MDSPPRQRIADLPGPKGLPLLGNARQIPPGRFHAWMEQGARDYGPLYRFSLMGRVAVVTSESAVIAGLMRDRPGLLRRTTVLSALLDEVGTRGLFTAEGEEWRSQRKLVMRALTPAVIHNFYPQLSGMTARLEQRWRAAAEARATPNLLRDLKSFTLDATVALALGHDINTLEQPGNPLQRDIDFIFSRVGRRLLSPLPYWRYVKLPADRALDAAGARVRAAVLDFIALARARLGENPALRARPANLLDALVAACDEPGSGFSDATVFGNGMTMVFAGEDTTSNTVAWIIDFLARHPDAQARAHQEAERVLGGAPVARHVAQLDQLPYIEAVAREAMRLKPVAPILAFEPVRDMVVADVQVPAGTLVMGLLRHAAAREATLEAPEQFRPERWLAGAQGAADPGQGLYPFGGGPRTCPGRYLAMVEIKSVVAMIMSNFALAPERAAPPVEERYTFTMSPSALPVRLYSRQ